MLPGDWSRNSESIAWIIISVMFIYVFAPPSKAAGGAQRAGVAASHDSSEQGSLILVRSWDSETGELVGWMPANHLAIVLQRLGSRGPRLNVNEAVTVDFPYRPGKAVERGEVRIADDVVVRQGKRWLPLDTNVNLVRVGKWVFYVKTIIFGESKWRRAAEPGPQRQPESRSESGAPASGDKPAADEGSGDYP